MCECEDGMDSVMVCVGRNNQRALRRMHPEYGAMRFTYCRPTPYASRVPAYAGTTKPYLFSVSSTSIPRALGARTTQMLMLSIARQFFIPVPIPAVLLWG